MSLGVSNLAAAASHQLNWWTPRKAAAQSL